MGGSRPAGAAAAGGRRRLGENEDTDELTLPPGRIDAVTGGYRGGRYRINAGPGSAGVALAPRSS